MSLLSEKLAPIWSAINRLQARQMSIFPATVTSVDPVRIRIDGESQSLAASPDVGVPVSQGARVRVLRYGTSHLIVAAIVKRFDASQMFTELASGVSGFSGAANIVGNNVTLRFGVNMTYPGGQDRTDIGTLHPSLRPENAVPAPVYRTNGAAMAAITSAGNVSIRWASGNWSGGIFVAASYPIR